MFNGKHTGPSNVKVVTVTVDPDSCDPAILDKWDNKLGNYTCSKKATQGGTKSYVTLDVLITRVQLVFLFNSITDLLT